MRRRPVGFGALALIAVLGWPAAAQGPAPEPAPEPGRSGAHQGSEPPERFRPSERVRADDAVAFPVDI